MICKLQNSAWKPPKTRVLSDFAISLLVKVTYDISHIYDIGNCFFLSLMHRLVWLGDCRAIVGVTTNQLGWEPSQIHVLRKCVICVHSHLYLVLILKALWELLFKSSSIKCSERLKFYWFCVLLWYKNQCWANTENVQIWQHFLCCNFLNGWMETSPEKEVFKSTVRQDDLRNHEFKVARQDQHNLALSYVSEIFNYQQPWSLVNPPNRLLLLQLSSS